MAGRDGRSEGSRLRGLVARGFTVVEDVVYAGLGLLPSGSAVVLAGGVWTSASTSSGVREWNVIPLLDRTLLILLIVELLYTVQVSFREHTISTEPLVLVGIIAAIRRVLLITAEIGHRPAPPEEVFPRFMIELLILTLLVLVLVSRSSSFARSGGPHLGRPGVKIA